MSEHRASRQSSGGKGAAGGRRSAGEQLFSSGGQRPDGKHRSAGEQRPLGEQRSAGGRRLADEQWAAGGRRLGNEQWAAGEEQPAGAQLFSSGGQRPFSAGESGRSGTCATGESGYDGYRIAVIGGGASGLAAAIAAAQTARQHPGLPLTLMLFDAGTVPGKKIPATGNGHCNLSNRLQTRECYRSGDGFLPEEFFHNGWNEEIDAFMHSIGILTHEKRGGYLYPRTDQASSVQQALLRAARHLGVEIRSGVRVIACRKLRNGRYRLTTGDSLQYDADRILVAAGGMAGRGYGCVGDGYRMACSLGHSLITPVPALCALYTSDPQLHLASGTRTSAGVELRIGDRTAAYAEGELQITDRGISGIPVFQISRYASGALYDQMKLSCEEALWPEGGQVSASDPSRREAGFLRSAVQQKAQPTILSMRDESGSPQDGTQQKVPSTVLSMQDGPGSPQDETQRQAQGPASSREAVTATLNFLPELSEEEWEEECSRRIAAIGPSDTLGDFCLGLVPDRAASWILARHGLVREKKIANLLTKGKRDDISQGNRSGNPDRNRIRTAGNDIPPESDAGAMYREAVSAILMPILNDMRGITIPVIGTEGFERAQVTSGGIPMDEIETTMESRLSPGCYLMGELLDVDGICGGYNLTWAFHSGLTAGRSAVLSLLTGEEAEESSLLM